MRKKNRGCDEKKAKKLAWYKYFPYLCKRINYFRQLEENFRCLNFRKRIKYLKNYNRYIENY